MLRRATTLLLVALLTTFATAPAFAQQEVTIREIQQVAQETLDSLDAEGADQELADINAVLESELAGQEVQFTAVLLTDPLRSGLRTVDDDGSVPIHGFVRDTAAASQGNSAMMIQIADGNPSSSGYKSATRGQVATFTGSVSYFEGGVQFAPSTVDVQGPYQQFSNLTSDIMEPVTTTLAEINEPETDSEVQVNWDQYNLNVNQYVRIEGVEVLESDPNDEGIPQLTVGSGENIACIQFDTRYSVRFHNAKSTTYPDEFLTRDPDDPFVPPAPGARLDIQGFLNYGSSFEAFPQTCSAVPDGAWFQIAPFQDSDVEVLGPAIGSVSSPSSVISPDEPVTITAEVTPPAGAQIDEVTLSYYTSEADDTTSVSPTSTSSDTYTFEIPAVGGDDPFVSYFIEATDDAGSITQSATQYYRTLADGINEIEDIQLTANSEIGPSPFDGLDAASMNLTATVQSKPDSSGFVVLQDDPSLAPWSGIVVEAPTQEMLDELDRGDQITITEADVFEDFGLTKLDNISYTVDSESGFLGYKVFDETSTLVSTDADELLLEGHESMMLRFPDVEITSTNPDGPDEDFDEYAFATQDTDASLRGDDFSSSIPASLNDSLMIGQQLGFIQGVWEYSFSNYKLQPETFTDLEGVSVDAETLAGAPSLTLGVNYPNPFSEETTISYSLDRSTSVTLTVYDMLGRKVKALVDARQPSGEQTVTFRPGDLPSGLYFYRLQTKSKTLTRKMTIVR